MDIQTSSHDHLNRPAYQSMDLRYKKFLSQKTFWCLDALRCFSILAVVWHHSGGDSYAAESLLFAGHHGVTLFFVISGFLITSLLIREKRQSGSISLSKFYMRRALRIFPLYYAVLLIYCALVYVIERHSEAGEAFFDNLIYFATYTSNYFVMLGGDRVIFYFAWSLAVEEQFYLLWPTIEKWLDEYTAGITVALLSILISLSHSNWIEESNVLVIFLIQHLSIPICLGVLLAHMLHSRKGFQIIAALCLRPGMVWVSLLLPFVLLTLPIIPVEAFYLSLVFMLCTLLLNENHVIRKFLSIKAFVKIGTVSYGLYLFHMLALNVVRKIIPASGDFPSLLAYQFTCFVLASALGYVIASLSYRYFESYFLTLKQKWSSHQPKPKGETSSTNFRNYYMTKGASRT